MGPGSTSEPIDRISYNLIEYKPRCFSVQLANFSLFKKFWIFLKDIFKDFFGLILLYTKFQTSTLSGTGQKVYCGGVGGWSSFSVQLWSKP